jgi:hypothetical protein
MFASLPVYATTIVVPTDYPTIQAAVNAAPAGATIKLLKGTYVEEVIIAKDLTIKGAGEKKTTIQSPATLTSFATQFGRSISAVIRITDGAHVSISDLTVSGPLPCNDVSAGIRVVKNATLDIQDAFITRAWPEAGPCTAGAPRARGIIIGLPANVSIDSQFGTNGHAVITRVTVDQFQEVGITVVSPSIATPSTATISDCTVIGGKSPFFPGTQAQFGIQLAAATVAQVTENKITGCACTLSSCGPDLFTESQAPGIFLQALAGPSPSQISENDISANDVGIYQFASPNSSSITENKLNNNRFFGIVIQDGDGATSENKIDGGEVGIAIVARTANTVGVLTGDKIKRTSHLPIQEIECCGFTATAIVQDR